MGAASHPGTIAGNGERRRRRPSLESAASAVIAGTGAVGSHRRGGRVSIEKYSIAKGGDPGPSYPGGKCGAGVYQTIINLMPPHEVYIEPFLGGGAVMRMKRPARLNIGLDLDARVAAEAARLVGRGDCRSPIAGRGEPAEFQFREDDGIEFLRRTWFQPAALVYCDPPYVLSTRSSRRRLYRFEMTDEQHRELLDVIKRLPCFVMISGYFSEMYSDSLKGWSSVQFQAMTRGGRPATEWVWFNFEAPLALHDYRYLGRDFRERERIKRKKQRWVQRLGRMPALEKQALLSAIAESSRIAGCSDGTRLLAKRSAA